jgi:hypothetical protein
LIAYSVKNATWNLINFPIWQKYRVVRLDRE